MRHPKLVAALAALALTVGGLALAGPALAADEPVPAPTTEVASSPDIEPTVPSTTSPEDSSTFTVETATPSSDSSTAPTPPTDATVDPGSSNAGTPSSPTSADTTVPALPSESAEVTSGPVTEAETTTSTSPASVEGWWLLPNGGTADNVTWPQAVTEADAVPCGVTAQVDMYPSAEALATLQADGQLDQGEDYSTVISWRFVYGGDCPPAPGPANPAATIETQCGAASVTVTNDGESILTASVVVYLDGDFFTALAVPAGQSVATPLTFAEDSGDHVLSVRTGPAFGDVELARAENINSDCISVVVPPVVTPPTMTPTPTPEATTPTEARTIAAQVVASEKLAATGNDVEGYVQIGAWAAGLMLLAGLVIILIRRRVPKQK